MERKFYKELWAIRFKKMLDLEVKSVDSYTALLEECKKNHENHEVQHQLEKLVSDEKRHAVLVQELIDILNRQTD